MDLFFKRYGEGPPLLILHGLLGSSGNWHTLSSKVFGQRFTVYALDLRNHGRSPHSDTFNYGVMADDVLGFMEQHHLSRAHLLGHSMGGKAAMHFALTYPDRVDRLVVADMAPKAYPPHHTDLLDALSALDLSRYTSRQQVDDDLSRSVRSPGVRQFLLKNLAFDSETRRYSWQMNLDVIRGSQEALSAGLEPGRTFDGPALFVRGSASDYVLDEDIDLIRQLFPRAQVATIEAGHWLHAEAPDAFARVVLEFLQEA